MDYDTEQSHKLTDELVDLWVECSIRCEKIENIIKQIKEKKN